VETKPVDTAAATTSTSSTRLASLSLDRPPSLKVRLKMRLDYLICVWCERYQKHLTFLHRATPQLADKLETASQRTLSVEAKQRMVQKLQVAHHR